MTKEEINKVREIEQSYYAECGGMMLTLGDQLEMACAYYDEEDPWGWSSIDNLMEEINERNARIAAVMA